MYYILPIDKLKEFKVGLVYLFGSKVLNIDSELSDIDIGVVFYETNILENYFGVYSRLYDIFFEAIKPDKDIDLVFLQKASLIFQHNVVCEGKILYEISDQFRADYEEKVVADYLDFEPVSDYFDKCLRQRLR